MVTKETSETVTSPLRRCESELQTEVTASKIILPVRLSLSWQTSRKRSIETCVCRTETQRELHYCKLKSQAAFFLLASFKPKSVNTNQFYSTETHLRCLLLVHVVWKPVITTCGHRGRCSANATSHRGGGNTTETDVVFWTEKKLLLQADRACFLKVCSGESQSERVCLCSLEMITNYLSVG